MTSIGAPVSITSDEVNLHAIIILFTPSCAKNMHEALRRMPRIRANLNMLLAKFCAIFRDNSSRMRADFFSDPLVQFMWQRYISWEAEFITNYFSELIEVKGKRSEAAILLRDIVNLSTRVNFEILRPELIQIKPGAHN